MKAIHTRPRALRHGAAILLLAGLAFPCHAEEEQSILKETAIHIWQDQRRMLTAPLRTSRTDLIIWGGAGASLLLLAPRWGNERSIDERFEQGINRADDSGPYLRGISHAGDAPILLGVSLGTYGFAYWREMPALKRTSLHVFEGLIDTGIALQLAKVLAGRSRPTRRPLDSQFYGPVGFFDNPSDNSSFPSGHSAMSFAAATIIHHETHETPYRWVGWSAYGLAGTIAYSRIYVEKHWLSDVVAGSVLGYSVGVLVEKYRHAKNQQTGRLVPTLQNESVGLAWVKTW